MNRWNRRHEEGRHPHPFLIIGLCDCRLKQLCSHLLFSSFSVVVKCVFKVSNFCSLSVVCRQPEDIWPYRGSKKVTTDHLCLNVEWTDVVLLEFTAVIVLVPGTLYIAVLSVKLSGIAEEVKPQWHIPGMPSLLAAAALQTHGLCFSAVIIFPLTLLSNNSVGVFSFRKTVNIPFLLCIVKCLFLHCICPSYPFCPHPVSFLALSVCLPSLGVCQ